MNLMKFLTNHQNTDYLDIQLYETIPKPGLIWTGLCKDVSYKLGIKKVNLLKIWFKLT